MADLFWPGGFQFFDDSGNPLNAGTIAFYDATTTNPRTMYRDSAETGGTAWGTSLTLNSAGRLTDAVYFPTGAWKYVLSTSGGSIIRTEDNIPGAVSVSNAAYALPQRPILTKATNYTVVAGDAGKKINVDATGGDVTITLLSAVTAGDAFDLVIQNVGATGTVTVGTSAAQTINGASSIKLRAKDDSAEFVADGANWTATITSEIRTVLAKTASYDITQADYGRLITFDATSGAITVGFPAAATAGSGFWVRVQKIDASANAVTLDPNLSETINGATTHLQTVQWEVDNLYCDGVGWTTISHSGLASTTSAGIVEIATEAEAAARTSNTVVPSAFSNPLPPGFLFGMELSNNVADATNDIDITAGKARDSTDTSNILGTAMTKRLDANWAAGTAQGFRNSAAAITNTTYHIYAVSKALGANPDYYAHTSTVGATVITALQAETGGALYIYARRIGSIMRVSNAIVGFVQTGDTFKRDAAIRDATETNPGTSAVARTLSVPTGLVLEAIVTHSLVDITAGSATYGLLTSAFQTDTAPSATVYDIQIAIDAAGSNAKNSNSLVHVLTNTSAAIRSRLSASTSDHTEDIVTHGWIDRRGRLA